MTNNIITYEHRAGSLGYVEEVCTDSFLNCGTKGAMGNLRNHTRDIEAMRVFAEDKFKAADFEARHGCFPLKNGLYFGKICPGTNGF